MTHRPNTRLILHGQALAELTRVPAAAVRIVSAGHTRGDTLEEWLLGPPTADRASAAWLAVATATHPELLPEALRRAATVATNSRWPSAALAVGTGPSRGHLCACALGPSGARPFSSVTVVGPGFHRPAVPHPNKSDNAEWHVWSRTRGAWGGEAAWRTVRGLHAAVVGCARSGSLVALGLRHMGVGRLPRIDPDRVETHNLGETVAVVAGDAGRPKAEALAERLPPRVDADGPAAAVPYPLGSLAGVKSADVVCCAADRSAARRSACVLRHTG
jgi:hypothetical protein